jgi:hypothetical protein
MNDLSKIATSELLKDLGDSVYDIFLCSEAMAEEGAHVALPKTGTVVASRAGHNLHFVRVICKELLRREYRPEPV